MGEHAGFIVAAYAVTGIVLLGMLLAILLDGRAQARALATLSERLARQGGGPPRTASDREQAHEP